jgi:aspartyl-tRNA(Asn)/glutamyl-tRNA(Gln) amidotransferase subunit B
VSGPNHYRRVGFIAEIIVASEAFRHIKLLTFGQEVKQETRGFDEDRAETYSLRSKEDAPDYRYMPDPNIPPLLLTEVNHRVSFEVHPP